jgi:serine/threonine-protein kinase RsbW
MTWPLRVALDEIVSNIVIHGGVARPPRIDVGFRRVDDGVEVTITDDGPPFDPMARPEPDVTLPIEARQPGGLGIALVKSLVDRVRYERIGRAGGGSNVLVLWKTIPSEAGGAGE